jgi:hypothetical protein
VVRDREVISPQIGRMRQVYADLGSGIRVNPLDQQNPRGSQPLAENPMVFRHMHFTSQ